MHKRAHGRVIHVSSMDFRQRNLAHFVGSPIQPALNGSTLGVAFTAEGAVKPRRPDHASPGGAVPIPPPDVSTPTSYVEPASPPACLGPNSPNGSGLTPGEG